MYNVNYKEILIEMKMNFPQKSNVDELISSVGGGGSGADSG